MTDVYTAIMKAADKVEKKPRSWLFANTHVPKSECGTPACALGWIGYYLGMSCRHVSHVGRYLCHDDGAYGDSEFYRRINEISFRYLEGTSIPFMSATQIAAALRIYANTYHARKPLPASVMEIFAEAVT